jgi:hypothetical protein
MKKTFILIFLFSITISVEATEKHYNEPSCFEMSVDNLLRFEERIEHELTDEQAFNFLNTSQMMCEKVNEY